MSAAPDRTAYRAAVAEIAAQASAKLPDHLGRIASAVKLVLAGDVDLLPDGGAMVASRSKASVEYHLVNGVCECADYPRVPGNLCAHRLAYGIARRAAERTPALPAPVETDASSPAAAGVTPDQDYLGNVETPAPPLPEAPASVNVRLTIGGREVQLTLRDTSEERLLVRLEEVLQRFPLPQPQAQPSPQQLSPQQHNAAAMHRKVVDFCPIHNCAMKENTKDGRRWFSHYDETAGRWCNGASTPIQSTGSQ